jgi:cytohesin
MSGQVSALQLLLERKAVCVNTANVYGITALHSAAVTAQHEAAELLLRAGANPDLASFVPTPPSAASLSAAAAAPGSASGTNASKSSKKGLSKGFLSASRSDTSKSREFTFTAPPDIGGRTALHLAARKGHVKVVEVLIRGKANISAARLDGSTPLHLAAFCGSDDTAQLLLDAGADPNIRDATQNTALQLAAWDGHLGVVRALIAKGADTEAADPYGRTPLILAAHDGHIEVVRELVSAGAKLEAATENGRTALFLAAEENQEDVVGVLLAAGANSNTARIDGCTILHVAATENLVGVARQLIAAGANVAKLINNHSPLTLAGGKGNLEIVQLLLGQHPDPSAPVPTGVHAGHQMVVAAKAAVQLAEGERGSETRKKFMATWAAVVRAIAGRHGNGEIADEVVVHELMMACEELEPMQDMCEMAAAWDRDVKAVRAAVVEERAALARERKELEQLRRGVQDLIVGAAGVLRRAADAAGS